MVAETADAVSAAAAASDAPLAAVISAFALAAAYHAPQRALTCALNGFALERLRHALALAGHARQSRVLDAAADFPAFAFFLASPVGHFAVTDAVFEVAIRMRVCAPILSPTSVQCRTVLGLKPRTCSLHASAMGDADLHALTCKCGGGAIRTHDLVRAAVASAPCSWGVPTPQEYRAGLPGQLRMDLFSFAAGLNRSPLAVDVTRRCGASYAALQRAEDEKVAKYVRHFAMPVTLRGFAFDELGRCGPQAREVVSLLVRAGARLGAGHPDDLALEVWASFGVGLMRATALRFAYFAEVNHDHSRNAPDARALAPAGQRYVPGSLAYCAGGIAHPSTIPRPRVVGMPPLGQQAAARAAAMAPPPPPVAGPAGPPPPAPAVVAPLLPYSLAEVPPAVAAAPGGGGNLWTWTPSCGRATCCRRAPRRAGVLARLRGPRRRRAGWAAGGGARGRAGGPAVAGCLRGPAGGARHGGGGGGGGRA